MQNFNISPTQVMRIFKMREEHEILMDGLVIVTSVIQMDAQLEDKGLIRMSMSWN